MGITAIAGVAGSLLSRLESLHSSKSAKTSAPPAPHSLSAKDASSVSNPGMLFTQLQNLSRQNPAEFKKITAQVAQQLQAAGANSATKTPAGSPQTDILNQMASNFQNASKTGNFSDLFSHAPQSANNPAASAAHQHYTAATGASDAGTIHNIFSQALSQIKTDLSGSAFLNTSSL